MESEATRALEEPCSNVGPPLVDSKRLDVLHYERLRSHVLHHVEEPEDVLASRISRTHLPSDGEPLTWRATDHEVGTTFPRPLNFVNAARDRFLTQHRVVSRDGERVEVISPGRLETRC